MHPTPHSEPIRGMSLCAVFRPSLTPVRSLIVTGTSPSALFIPMRILPSFPGASRTEKVRDWLASDMLGQRTVYLKWNGQRYGNHVGSTSPHSSSSEETAKNECMSSRRGLRAEPLPDLNTRSIGQPQFRSTKSTFGPHSRAIASAAGTKVAGLFPASCTPKIPSEGCLRTKDHSSFDPARKEVANPTFVGRFSETVVLVHVQCLVAHFHHT